MENTTKILTTKSGNLIDNVIQLPNREKSDEKDNRFPSEFPYKHLLPKLEAAWF